MRKLLCRSHVNYQELFWGHSAHLSFSECQNSKVKFLTYRKAQFFPTGCSRQSNDCILITVIIILLCHLYLQGIEIWQNVHECHWYQRHCHYVICRDFGMCIIVIPPFLHRWSDGPPQICLRRFNLFLYILFQSQYSYVIQHTLFISFYPTSARFALHHYPLACLCAVILFPLLSMSKPSWSSPSLPHLKHTLYSNDLSTVH